MGRFGYHYGALPLRSGVAMYLLLDTSGLGCVVAPSFHGAGSCRPSVENRRQPNNNIHINPQNPKCNTTAIFFQFKHFFATINNKIDDRGRNPPSEPRSIAFSVEPTHVQYGRLFVARNTWERSFCRIGLILGARSNG